METERESVTQTRVRLYQKALDQLREENEAKEQEAALAKGAEQPANKPEAATAEGPGGSGSDLAHSTTHGDSDKA